MNNLTTNDTKETQSANLEEVSDLGTEWTELTDTECSVVRGGVNPNPGLLGNYGLLGTGLGGPWGLLGTGLLRGYGVY